MIPSMTALGGPSSFVKEGICRTCSRTTWLVEPRWESFGSTILLDGRCRWCGADGPLVDARP